MIDSIFNFSTVSTAMSASSTHVNPLNEYERQNALTFHIETGDYFLFLSTLLSFAEEALATGDRSQNLIPIQVEAIKAARKDLQFLNDHYRIESCS